MTKPTTAATALWTALTSAGVDTCFANPGTTELDLVRALEEQGNIRCVLGLQENVCTGAADGYGRMRGQAAATLVHLGPGFANGIANLHNARRARTPLINIIGDQASWHLPFDAPLTSDIESLAKPVSGWVHRIVNAQSAATAASESVRQSLLAGGQGATLIFPADFQAASVLATPAGVPVGQTEEPLCDAARSEADFDCAAAVQRLRAARRIVFLLGGGGKGSGLSVCGQHAAARLCAALGACAFAETFPARAERGQGLPDFDRLPYFPDAARAVLGPADLVVLAGALPPVTYFGYAGQPSALVETERLFCIGAAGQAVAERLKIVADALGAPAFNAPNYPQPESPTGALTPSKVAAVVVRELPQQAIVSVEGGTCGYPFYAASKAARVHTALTNTGGAIGQGLPVALGAALACPDRPVLALLSDGSAQYTVQTLWSLAHEQCNVVVLVAANHQYAILRNELRRSGAPLGARAEALTALDAPRIDWVGLARAYGVPASRAATAEELTTQLQQALARTGPTLVEIAL